MSAFQTPTIDESTSFLVALFAALFPQADVSEESFNWKWSKTQAGGTTDNHAHIEAVKTDLFPDSAEGDMADRWATILGRARKAATPARKDAALRVFGTPATNVPDATQFKHSSGLLFKTNGAAVIAASGYIDCNVLAIDVGSATRLNKGQILSLTAPIAGLNDDAELQLSLDQDGTDAESDGSLQRRMLLRLSSPPLGGAATDYVQWAIEETGIEAAFCYPNRQGAGSVDLTALHAGSGASRLLLAGEITDLQAKIDAKRPVGATFRLLTVTAKAVDTEYTVLPDGDPSTEFDWDDSTAPLVLAWTAATRKVQFQGGTRPATMKAGDRLTIKPVAGGGTGQEYTIESLSGADAVILEEAPNPAPANNDVVYSGGPLVAPIRAAQQALFDALGTANPDLTRYGAWEGNLRPGAVDRVSRAIAGVLDGSVVAPVAIVSAADTAGQPPPLDATIELLIAGRMLVRRFH